MKGKNALPWHCERCLRGGAGAGTDEGVGKAEMARQ